MNSNSAAETIAAHVDTPLLPAVTSYTDVAEWWTQAQSCHSSLSSGEKLLVDLVGQFLGHRRGADIVTIVQGVDEARRRVVIEVLREYVHGMPS